ncbi:membrane protein [Mesorhizobium sp. L-8-10]|uniref:OpgC family protein n=1 Tax=Mesorhizobium sp. L-8-10 TaxID=2744523 RepID=UPI001925F5BF|nr:OpgC domain-containing protein [Mesorhizobium sp. L-8-10]BCH31057.1 membrane protein [Mesorhizobium sp. L-8-10]
MTEKNRTERDTRIDVLRALALLTIFVNHVPGTVFEHVTYRNFGFSDAAEAFVLISGISIVLAYGGKFKPGSRLVTTLRMWRRAGVLYASHIVTTMTALAIFAVAAVHASRPELLVEINIGPVISDTARALVGIVTLGHQIGYNNILSLYAALIVMSPVFLLAARASPALALGLSGGLWLVAGIWQIAPPNYPEAGFWFLNPLSWQFLFMIGIVGRMHVAQGGRISADRRLVWLAAAYVVISLAWVHSPLWGRDAWLGLPAVLTGFDKTFLSLPRLLHILAVAYLLATAAPNLLRTRIDHPLAILGKRSLPVFIAGTVVAMVAQVVKQLAPASLALDTLLIASGIGIQFALAYYLEWLAGLGKRTAHGETRREAAVPALRAAPSC